MEEEDAKKPPTFQIGQDLSDLSVDELNEIVVTLKDEMSRLETAISGKSSHLTAAEALFK